MTRTHPDMTYLTYRGPVNAGHTCYLIIASVTQSYQWMDAVTAEAAVVRTWPPSPQLLFREARHRGMTIFLRE
jgi:hypothetical protein